MPAFNPFDHVKKFEEEMCRYTGAPRAVAVDSCTAALFLCFSRICRYWPPGSCVFSIPQRTFVGVPMMAIQAGAKIQLRDQFWEGRYAIRMVDSAGEPRCSVPTVWDSALRMQRGMFNTLPFQHERFSPIQYLCVSFQYRKHIPIGRGGMILHNGDDETDNYFRRMRFFGRAEVPAGADPGPTHIGWRFYMTPEEASRGLCFLQNVPDAFDDLHIDYPDLKQYKVLREHIVPS